MTSSTSVAIAAAIMCGVLASAPAAATAAGPAPSVAVSGMVCIDEARDGVCDDADPPVFAEEVRLIAPDDSPVIDVDGRPVAPRPEHPQPVS